MNTEKQTGESSVGVTPKQSQYFITYPATVSEVIPAAHAGEPDQARIFLDDVSEPYNEVRVKRALPDSRGDTVNLEKGDHVRLRVGNCEGTAD